jgi:ribosomal protein S3
LLKKLIKEFSQLYINLKGLKLKISGKINGVSRTKNLTILIGTISDSSKSFNNFYAFINSITFTGIFGIKL